MKRLNKELPECRGPGKSQGYILKEGYLASTYKSGIKDWLFSDVQFAMCEKVSSDRSRLAGGALATEVRRSGNMNVFLVGVSGTKWGAGLLKEASETVTTEQLLKAGK